ncbi:type II toxin-antitoxin system VapC family toxin [Thermoleptolyngbya oregonensis NK1-22]|uniref:Type II toxin-antitoxin system VapC family toxin n=1 Tax=Thermoleptolyngbya oregonensis NK1-22 TaxID=2547457 RepID=A0AA96Y7D6_9CYAN|nr:type II toxin-antitoxin system VapC family toxin [Thermoleptolyngbya oregonensis]WOB42428.1 type II toxin-antitoxin system VapC family toxin [Thermoleptolyngbya oregonensis NK1-22]
MTKVTFDTNILISRKNLQLPDSFYMSVVVLQELVAGAKDETALKSLTVAYREYEKSRRLLVPTAEDWWLVGKVIYALQRGLKSQRGGLTPKMSADQKYRITHDVLIARTAKRAGVMVVTDNVRDFEAIQRFCNVRLTSGEEYFNS